MSFCDCQHLCYHVLTCVYRLAANCYSNSSDHWTYGGFLWLFQSSGFVALGLPIVQKRAYQIKEGCMLYYFYLFFRSPIALQGFGISQHKESSVADFRACSGIVDITQLPIVPACCAHSANHCDLMNPLSVQSHSATSTKQTMLVISNWQKPGIIEYLQDSLPSHSSSPSQTIKLINHDQPTAHASSSIIPFRHFHTKLIRFSHLVVELPTTLNKLCG